MRLTKQDSITHLLQEIMNKFVWENEMDIDKDTDINDYIWNDLETFGKIAIEEIWSYLGAEGVETAYYEALENNNIEFEEEEEEEEEDEEE